MYHRNDGFSTFYCSHKTDYFYTNLLTDIVVRLITPFIPFGLKLVDHFLHIWSLKFLIQFCFEIDQNHNSHGGSKVDSGVSIVQFLLERSVMTIFVCRKSGYFNAMKYFWFMLLKWSTDLFSWKTRANLQSHAISRGHAFKKHLVLFWGNRPFFIFCYMLLFCWWETLLFKAII